MTLDQLETYLHDGARPEIIAASLIFLHGWSAEQAEQWIADHQDGPDEGSH